MTLFRSANAGLLLIVVLAACAQAKTNPDLISRDAKASLDAAALSDASPPDDASDFDPEFPDGSQIVLDAALILDAGPDSAIEQDAALPEPDPDQDPTDPAPKSVKQTYQVLHWNIAGGKENRCQTAGITRAVVRYVRERNIDFVGLNEVCPAQYRSIHDALRKLWGKGNAKFSAYVGDGTNRIVGNAIYSRFNLDNISRDRLGSDQYGSRNLLCGQLRKYPHLRFCSTHLTPADTTARKQLGVAMKRINDWWANRRDTVILSGDLNIHPNDPGLNAVYASSANHAKNNPNNHGNYRELDDDDPDHCRGYGERTTPGTTGGPCQEGGKIDFVFVRENRIVDGKYNGDALNVPADCTGRCSDHRAVFGRVVTRIRL